MPNTTTQAAVKSALKTAILARTLITTDHVQVLYGEPGDTGRRECVWIGTALSPAPQEPRAFRPGLRQEEYTIRIAAENWLLDTPEKAEARAVVLAGEVEACVIANQTLGVTGVSFIMPAGVSTQTTEADGTPRAIATISLMVSARLVP
jgi:hypothetical protein